MRQIGIDNADGSAGFRAAMKVSGVKRDRSKAYLCTHPDS